MNETLKQIASLVQVELRGDFTVRRNESGKYTILWLHLERDADHAASWHEGKAMLLCMCGDEANAYTMAYAAADKVRDTLDTIALCDARVAMPDWYKSDIDNASDMATRFAQMIYDARDGKSE